MYMVFSETAELRRETRVKKPISKLAQACLDRVRLLCILKAQEVTTNVMYRLPHAISTAVASPCQTLRELLAGGRDNPAHQLAVPHKRSSPKVCTSVLFHLYSVSP